MNFLWLGYNITGVTNTLETVTTLFRNVCNAVSFEMKLVQPEIQLNIFCDNHTYIFFSVYLVTLLDVTHAIETVTNFPAICVTLYLHWTACARCR